MHESRDPPRRGKCLGAGTTERAHHGLGYLGCLAPAGYWCVGTAFCVFFGPTPASKGPGPRAYGNVNPFGQILEDVTVLRAVSDGEPVTVEATLKDR